MSACWPPSACSAKSRGTGLQTGGVDNQHLGLIRLAVKVSQHPAETENSLQRMKQVWGVLCSNSPFARRSILVNGSEVYAADLILGLATTQRQRSSPRCTAKLSDSWAVIFFITSG
jgi:hypothetical protein